MITAELLQPTAQDGYADFERRGYARLSGLFPREILDIAFRYFLSYAAVPDYYDCDERYRALDRYADALGEAMMPAVQIQLERAIGRTLLPTNSFVRIYTTDSILKKHVHRGACEYSATMTVGYRNTKGLWPIFVESQGEDVAVELDVGDAMVYKRVGRDSPTNRQFAA